MSQAIATLQLWCFNVRMSRKQRCFLACTYIGFRKIARECTLVSVEPKCLKQSLEFLALFPLIPYDQIQ